VTAPKQEEIGEADWRRARTCSRQRSATLPEGHTEGVASSADPSTRSLLWEAWGWDGAHRGGTKDVIRAPSCLSSWRKCKTEKQRSAT